MKQQLLEQEVARLREYIKRLEDAVLENDMDGQTARILIARHAVSKEIV